MRNVTIHTWEIKYLQIMDMNIHIVKQHSTIYRDQLVIYYINLLVCAFVRLWPLDAQTTWQEEEKWRWTQRKMTGKRWDDRRMRCVRLFESWNPGPETEVLKLRSWGPSPEIEVRRAAQG